MALEPAGGVEAAHGLGQRLVGALLDGSGAGQGGRHSYGGKKTHDDDSVAKNAGWWWWWRCRLVN